MLFTQNKTSSIDRLYKKKNNNFPKAVYQNRSKNKSLNIFLNLKVLIKY